MTQKKTRRANATDAAGRVVEEPARVDTSDLSDSHPGTKLGTLRDAIERARARRAKNGDSPREAMPTR